MSDLSMRIATLGDVSAIRKIDPGLGEPKRDRYLNSQILECRIIVAELDEEAVGCVGYEVLWGHLPMMTQLRVQEARRRRGVARALVEDLSDRLASRQAKMILSSVEIDNEDSMKMHLSLGFTVCGYLNYGNSYTDEVFLRRDLSR